MATAGECGGVQRATPRGWHRHYRPPLAVGDSTMLLSLPALAREGFSADAHGCRQYSEATNLLGALARGHQLPHLIVIALGANGAISAGQVRETLRILGPDRVLVLVTQRQSGSDGQVERDAARHYSAQVRVLDWVSYSAAHPDWFQPDGLHLTFAGAAGFARLLGRSLTMAAPFRPKPPPKCPAAVPGPPVPLLGVSMLVARGVLHVRAGSSRLTVQLANLNPFPVQGVARLGYAVGPGTIATACVSVPAGSRADVTMSIGQPALADLQFRGRYRVRLLLALTGLEGVTAALTGTYLLN